MRLKAIQVKPSIFWDEKLNECGAEATLLYIGLAMLSDNGWLQDDVQDIAERVFPYGGVDVPTLLDSLKNIGLIRRHKTGRIEIAYPTQHFSFPHKTTASSSNRRASKLRAMPAWADKHAIKEIYKKSKELSEGSIRYHVDHYYPLKGKTVSGLHVPQNLQIIPSTENLRKSNKVPE